MLGAIRNESVMDTIGISTTVNAKLTDRSNGYR